MTTTTIHQAPQEVVDRLIPGPGPLHQQRQLLLHPVLTDELLERARPQGHVELAILLG